MKKYLAVLLIAIVAVSVLSVAGVVTTSVAAGWCGPPSSNALNSQVGTTVNVNLRVSPAIIVPQSRQVILVTILSNKNNFDPQIGTLDLTTVKFGRAGTEAVPMSMSRTDVNHDGIKDVTLAFRAKDTGLRFFDRQAKLTGEINNVMCPAVCGGSCVHAFAITGTGSVLAL